MKRLIYTFLVIITPLFSVAQTKAPGLQSTEETPDFTIQNRAPGDSCGAYFNNYIGLAKTTIANVEELRMGNSIDNFWYGGMAQHFHANQPIEVSGVEFYGYQTGGFDSIMVITKLNDYTAGNDSAGVELARDTVWVKHTAFDIVLPNISVKSYFDAPVTVTQDYIVTVETPTDSSLMIVTSDPGNSDGNGEGLGFYYYNNVFEPSFIGYYNQLTEWGAAWDFDALISPLVKYDLNDGFTLNNDSICPNVVSAACVSYSQVPIYTDYHYNGFSASATDHILWLWGDGFQNTNLTSACHTYTNSGDYDITLRDTLRRWDFNSPYCVSEVIEPLHVIYDPVANFSFSQSASTVMFTNLSTSTDSVWWDFGDMSGTDSLNPTHVYDTLLTFDVWLYAYNECGAVDSIMMQVTTDDVGFEQEEVLDFNIYPNPANQNVTINGKIQGAQIELINILGQTIYQETATSGTVSFNISDFANGTYFIRLTDQSEQVTKKLVIRH